VIIDARGVIPDTVLLELLANNTPLAGGRSCIDPMAEVFVSSLIEVEHPVMRGRGETSCVNPSPIRRTRRRLVLVKARSITGPPLDSISSPGSVCPSRRPGVSTVSAAYQVVSTWHEYPGPPFHEAASLARRRKARLLAHSSRTAAMASAS
jgi:hypothetical protein